MTSSMKPDSHRGHVYSCNERRKSSKRSSGGAGRGRWVPTPRGWRVKPVSESCQELELLPNPHPAPPPRALGAKPCCRSPARTREAKRRRLPQQHAGRSQRRAAAVIGFLLRCHRSRDPSEPRNPTPGQRQLLAEHELHRPGPVEPRTPTLREPAAAPGPFRHLHEPRCAFSPPNPRWEDSPGALWTPVFTGAAEHAVDFPASSGLECKGNRGGMSSQNGEHSPVGGVRNRRIPRRDRSAGRRNGAARRGRSWARNGTWLGESSTTHPEQK